MDTEFRIIGPHHTRLLTVEKIEHTNRPGHIGRLAAQQLMKQGFRPYTGPAEADKGWVIPGTDPKVIPRPLDPRTGKPFTP